MSETKQYKVAFARFPGDGTERKETVAWQMRTLVQMSKDPRIKEVIPICIASTPIYASRNKAVLEAKEAGAEYLLAVDSDMAPDIPRPGAVPFWPSAWEFMMERRDREEECRQDFLCNGEFVKGTAEPYLLKHFAPATIAAPYCGPPPQELVYVFQWTSLESDTPNPNFRLEMIPREQAAFKAGIEEVAALPTGLILYDMRVFDILPMPWYDYEWQDASKSERASTEDVYQTRNASLLNLPQYVNWSAWSGHVKTKLVGPPAVVTRDQVHQSLVDAVRRGLDSDDRLIVVGDGACPSPADQGRR